MNELLPRITAEEDGQIKSDKESYLLDHPDILQKFGVELLPTLIQVGVLHLIICVVFVCFRSPLNLLYLNQVVNSGVNLFICYCALSVISKLVHFSKADALHSLLKAANFPR